VKSRHIAVGASIDDDGKGVTRILGEIDSDHGRITIRCRLGCIMFGQLPTAGPYDEPIEFPNEATAREALRAHLLTAHGKEMP